MTYEEFKQLAEHPQHRDVPVIFKLEVLETEELEEKKRSHYPKYKVNTYCPQAFTTTLEEAERLMHQDVLYRKKMKEEDDYPLDTFCYYISEIPMGLLHYDRECLSERVYDGEGKLIDRSYCCSRFSIEPTLKSKACLKCLYFTKIISDLCRNLECFSYLYTINQTE